MSKQLIIAEKPSVAADIARALGGFARKGEYYESEHYVLCSAVGHLLELAAPAECEVRRGKWSFEHLPVIPPRFELVPIAKNQGRLELLLRLLRRKDVRGIVNACDAGREGELIFRYIVEYAKTKKPIARLWLQSMTPQAIREGFASLREEREMRALADAAKCRAEADWLIGINGTRAMTAFNSREGGFYLTPVGRVQTPTLAILVEREERIRAFVPRAYWEVHARFAVEAGEYAGRWFDPQFRKDEADPDRRPERLWEAARAEAIAAACRGRRASVSEETKSATQLSPLLFDLTSLQREANSRFGYSARTTLAIAQALYERHKALTYPRTDARALPEDYVATVKRTMEALAAAKEYAPLARKILEAGWVKPNRRVFDDSKVSDHFAIIPTLEAPKHLPEAEARIYDLVVRRFLAVFYPAAEYLQTTRITQVGEHAFRTEGRVLQRPGWLEVYGRAAQEEAATLPALAAGERAQVREVSVQANQTRPPPRYTEATLLAAMEGAGKLVEDEELRAAMEAKGLGTPATRAQIIEDLIAVKYVRRAARELVPTFKAYRLLLALRHFGVEEITSPQLTGDWEYKLKLMEARKLGRREFMEHIEAVARDLVARIRDGRIPDTAFATVRAPCPKCGGTVQENYRKFACQSCDFSLWTVLSGREWDPEEVAELLEKRVVGPFADFISRQGRPFAALVRLTDDFRIEFDFGQEAAAQAEKVPDFGTAEPLGPCPKCGARVFAHGMAYVCEHAVGASRRCDFRSGRVILQQPVEPEQMRKLLATGRTDLLTGFVSRRGRRFKAFLVRTPAGKVGFEFPPRAEKPAPAAAEKPKAARAGTAARKRRAA